MTIKEKAKAYDEALTKARNIVNSINVGLIGKDSFEAVFPELKESEDEKIRKFIIKIFKDSQRDGISEAIMPEQYDKIFDWLEKQGEQKPAEYTLEQAANIFLDALSNSPYNNKPITDAQTITKQLLNFLQNSVSYNPDALIVNEQKPAEWHREDEQNLNACLGYIPDEFLRRWLMDAIHVKYDKNTWSEEDEQYLLVCKNALEKYQITDKWDAHIIFHWLKNKIKSLRPQPTWTPSDGQMVVLNDLIINGHLSNANERILKSLQEQLKKLRGE